MGSSGVAATPPYEALLEAPVPVRGVEQLTMRARDRER